MSKQKKFRAKNQQQYQRLLKKAKKNPTRYDKPHYQQIVKGIKKPTVIRATHIQHKKELSTNDITKHIVEHNKTAIRPTPIPLTKKDVEELKDSKFLKESLAKHLLKALGEKAIKLEYGTEKEKEHWRKRDVEREAKEAMLPFFGVELKPQHLDDKKRYLTDRKEPDLLEEPKDKKSLVDASKLLSNALLTSKDFEATNIVGFKYEDNFETVQFDTGVLSWVFTPVSSKEYELSAIKGGKVNIARFEDQFNKMQLKFFDFFGSEALSRVTVTTNITFREIRNDLIKYEEGDDRRIEIVGREWLVFWGEDGRQPLVDTKDLEDIDGKRKPDDSLNYDKETGVDYIKLDDDLVEDEKDKRVKG